ncbi:MAG: type 4a pilus biogenesis protein PilO [Nitrospirota bacterium]|nr:type 4a pilus biogenesis protein PilO [Nitrospirota bacterium]
MKFFLQKERKLVMATIALAVVNLLFYLALVYPMQSMVHNKEDDYSRERQRLVDLRNQAALAKTVVESKAALAELWERLPEKDDLPAFIGSFHALAKEYDLRIPTVKYEPKKEKGEVMTSLFITLPVTGNYPDIRGFIQDMELSDRLIMLENIGISASGSDGGGGTQLQLTMTTYIRPAIMPEFTVPMPAEQQERTRGRR